MGLAVTNPARRQFLRGDIKLRDAPIRPPWALPEERFTLVCTRCNDCADACSERLITVGSGGFPQLDFRPSGCTFCGDCVTACNPRALQGDTSDPSCAWSLMVAVDTQCLALNGVVCRTCGDVCEPRAIRFQLEIGGRARPQIDQNLCTGCGSCINPCPVQALRLSIKPK
jgi:ferredoxin-type protein NapF